MQNSSSKGKYRVIRVALARMMNTEWADTKDADTGVRKFDLKSGTFKIYAGYAVSIQKIFWKKWVRWDMMAGQPDGAFKISK